MSDTPQANTERKRSRNHVAGVIALIALAVAGAAWFWTTRQPPHEASLGTPQVVMVVGAGAFIVALLAEIRAMSFWDVLEMLWEAVLGVFSLIGVVLKGIWNAICGLFGWN